MPEQSEGWLFRSLTEEWQGELADLYASFLTIETELNGENFLPKRELIFAALTKPISSAKVLIAGQDPYPKRSDAMGLAFSIPKHNNGEQKLPPTLRNIFRELAGDVGGELRRNGDLSDWRESGVVLLNRTLTLLEGQSNSHKNIGWDAITNRITERLAKTISVAILWGKDAEKLTPFLDGVTIISSPHPSPLASYRGFFGSRPFTQTNMYLKSAGRKEIDWG